MTVQAGEFVTVPGQGGGAVLATLDGGWLKVHLRDGSIAYVHPHVLPNGAGCWAGCAGCGVPAPAAFYAEDWNEVVSDMFRRDVLCRPCYENIKAVAEGS